MFYVEGSTDDHNLRVCAHDFFFHIYELLFSSMITNFL